MRSAAALTAAATLTLGLLTGCTTGADQPHPSPTPAPPVEPSTGRPGADAEEGYSAPVEDRVYPEVGDPGVDALHYRLHLDWSPASRTLDAVETVELRATVDADHLQLDLGAQLTVTGLTVDGREAPYSHDGKDLVVERRARADEEYTLEIRYTGTPEPVPAPVTRHDYSSTGWTVTDDGGVWTMQEPYGAFTWYAVNDQPSDKALYDFRISVPAPFVGVANGELLSRRRVRGETVTRWRLEDPAASYLVTIAIGHFTRTEDASSSGVPITYWTPSDRPDLLARLRKAPAALDFVEDRLGPYPYDSLGFVVVDSRSGMETQTMITLGDTRYATSPEVLVHEITHQWYGDQVTPVDWRDLWMNEGMATYVQAIWMSESSGDPLSALIGHWASLDRELRAEAGPPAAFRRGSFGSGNVYYIPAVMWDALRRRLGDEVFWRLAREWPSVHEDGNADYADLTAWWSEQSGEDLSEFFASWLLSDEPPERD